MKRYDFGKDWHFRTKESGWKKVTLPHDAQLLDQRKPDAPGGSGHGYFVGNVYEYEKSFLWRKTGQENISNYYLKEFIKMRLWN